MAAPLFGLMAAATLAACGVPPSGVIEAGEPASGMVSPGPMSPSPVTTSLFFLHDGDLTAYPRTTNTGSIAVAVRLLFEGPTAHESATATTELPRLSQASLVTTGDDGILSVQLPDETSPLSHRAMLQLVCTVAQVTPSLPMSQADAEAAERCRAQFLRAQRCPCTRRRMDHDAVGRRMPPHTPTGGTAGNPIQGYWCRTEAGRLRAPQRRTANRATKPPASRGCARGPL